MLICSKAREFSIDKCTSEMASWWARSFTNFTPSFMGENSSLNSYGTRIQVPQQVDSRKEEPLVIHTNSFLFTHRFCFSSAASMLRATRLRCVCMGGGGGHCPYFLFFSQKTPGKEKTVGQRRPQLSVLFVQSCLTLCDPKDCNPPGSSVHVILQARILEWVAMPFSRGSSQPRDQTQVSCIAGGFFTIWVTREALPQPGKPSAKPAPKSSRETGRDSVEVQGNNGASASGTLSGSGWSIWSLGSQGRGPAYLKSLDMLGKWINEEIPDGLPSGSDSLGLGQSCI